MNLSGREMRGVRALRVDVWRAAGPASLKKTVDRSGAFELLPDWHILLDSIFIIFGHPSSSVFTRRPSTLPQLRPSRVHRVRHRAHPRHDPFPLLPTHDPSPVSRGEFIGMPSQQHPPQSRLRRGRRHRQPRRLQRRARRPLSDSKRASGRPRHVAVSHRSVRRIERRPRVLLAMKFRIRRRRRVRVPRRSRRRARR